MVLGFLTREFTLHRGDRDEPLVAVFVPTNHLYLGDVLVYPRDQVVFPELSVEEGIRVFLTGGMALPSHLGDAARSKERPLSRSANADDQRRSQVTNPEQRLANSD